MPDYMEFEDHDAPLEDYEYPDEEDVSEESYTSECPHCGADVYDDAERCPVCGEYITWSAGHSPWLGRGPLWIILGIAGILAVLFALVCLGGAP